MSARDSTLPRTGLHGPPDRRLAEGNVSLDVGAGNGRSTLAVLLLAAVLTGLLAAGALGATKPTVRLQATTSTVKVGHVLHLARGTVRNAKASATSVLIYEMVGTHWQRIATARFSAKHTFAATVTPEEQGRLDLRAVYRFKMDAATAVVLSNTVAITVKPAPGDWVAVACGSGQSLALKTDGSLWAWGDNTFGQLGLGDTKNRTHPQGRSAAPTTGRPLLRRHTTP